MADKPKPKIPGIRFVSRALKILRHEEKETETHSRPAEGLSAETLPLEQTPPSAQTAEQTAASGVAATRPLSDEEVNIETALPIRPPQVTVGIGYSVGMQRDHNEDAVYSTASNLSTNGRDHLFGLFVIADGMGGHQHGEVASEAAIRAFSSFIISSIYEVIFGTNPHVPEASLMELAQEAVRRAHRAVIEQAPGGGTTLTGVILLGDNLTIAHVGDSRAYIIYPDGRMTLLTRDHSLVKRLEELGQLTEEEAAVHPQRNVLYRAIGQAEPFEPDVFTVPAPKQGYLMICSDGLWGVVPEDKIFETITQAENPSAACQQLVRAANEAGGPDNISVILVRFAAK